MNTAINISRREFLRLTGAVAAGWVLTSCAPSPTPSQPVPAPTAIATTAASTSAPKGPVTLEFWQISQGPNYDKVMKQAIEEYQGAHSNVKINMSVQPQQDMDTKSRSVFTSGGPGPDLMVCGSPFALGYARMPYGFMDLTDRIQAEGLKNKIPPMAWVSSQENNKLYSVPFTALLWFLHYNKDLYQAAGISAPPETLDDLLANSKKIFDASKDRFGFLAFTTWVSWILEGMWYNDGVGLFDGAEDYVKYDTSKPITINKPQAVAALEYLKSLAETAPGGLKGNNGVKSGDADAAFAKGNLAHFYTHTIHTSQIQGYNAKMVPLKNWDLAIFPKGSKRRGTMFSPLEIGISKGSKNADAAWDFLSYLSNQVEGRIGPSVGSLPLNPTGKVDETQVGSWLLPIGRKALQGEIWPEPFLPQASAFYSALTAAVEAFFLGQKTAQQALDDAAAESKKSL